MEGGRQDIFILFSSNRIFMIYRAVDFLSSNLTSGIILPTRFEFSNAFLDDLEEEFVLTSLWATPFMAPFGLPARVLFSRVL